MGEHWINPVLYTEFEDISADKTIREVVGHDGVHDFLVPNWQARQDKEREVELKLILGSNVKGWNISENFIAEKNLAAEPWEFGYAIGVSRPLKAASSRECAFCANRFQEGAEMYGGLGDRYSFGLHDTSHYPGPTINWTAPNGTTIGFSPQFGLNGYSIPCLYRFSVVRDRTVLQPLPPERSMMGVRILLIPAILVFAQMMAAASTSDGAWLAKVPPREHDKANPYRDRRTRWRRGGACSWSIVPSVTATTPRAPRSGPA